MKNFISLFDKFPEISKLWDENKNILTPKDISFGSHKLFWWKCPEAEDHEWMSSVNAVTNNLNKSNGNSCPFCHGLRVCKSNCLLSTHPVISEEWHYDKNNIKPSDVVAGSHKKVWWQCRKNKSHIWFAQIKSRALGDRKCPFCSGKKACEDNCLFILPELIAEWDYDKNILSPSELTLGSHKKVWWKCLVGHFWIAAIRDRTIKGSSCPFCKKKSKGEERIALKLKNLGIDFVREYRFDDCKCKNSLPFDFVVFDNNIVVAAIEYNGKQHYEPVSFGGDPQKNIDKIKITDRIKKEYCQNNDIKLLIIPYYDFDKIDNLLYEFVNDIKIVINDVSIV